MGARDGRRPSSGARAERSATSTSARAPTTRPRPRSGPSWRRGEGHDLPEPTLDPPPTGRGPEVERPSDEVFPGGSYDRAWEPGEPGEPLIVEYAAGGAWAALDGSGSVTVTVDDGESRSIELEGPGPLRARRAPRARDARGEDRPGRRDQGLVGVLLPRRRRPDPGLVAGRLRVVDADLLRQHEADRLVDRLQLADVGRPAVAEHVDELGDELLRRAGART